MADRFMLPGDSEVVARVTVDNGTTFVQDMQECSGLLASCAEERAQDALRGHRKTAPFRCVMELPTALVTALKAAGMDILSDREALRKVVNDPAFAAFRTSGGRL